MKKRFKQLLQILIIGGVLAIIIGGVFETFRLQESKNHSFTVVDKENSQGRYSRFTALWGYADNGNYICIPVVSLEKYEIGKTYSFNLRNFDIENGLPGFIIKLIWSTISVAISITLLIIIIILLLWELAVYVFGDSK